ncbi:MAG: hypothetical protein RL015_3636, partial [Verrucomicrobiota bacterium]
LWYAQKTGQSLKRKVLETHEKAQKDAAAVASAKAI